jgi:hypothetical protein
MIKNIKKQIILFILPAMLLLSFCRCDAVPTPTVSSVSGVQTPRSAFGASAAASASVVSTVSHAPKVTSTVVLDFAGDCALSDINDEEDPLGFPEVYKKAKSLTYPFDKVKSFFASDDLTIVNFECTLTNAKEEGNKQWHFRGSASYAAILPASSIEVAVLSNNHCPLDYLAQGYRDSVRNLTSAGVGMVEENIPFIKTVKGIPVVIIGDSSIIGENTTVTAGAAERVLAQIRQYKQPGNIVVVDMHWGNEYKDVQPWQKTAARQFVDAGADLVVGQHPHMLSGIEVTTDILFLQKRDRMIDAEPKWVHLGETEDNVTVNQYFLDHPDMMLGTMAYSKRMYGNENETTCNPFEGADLAEQLGEAMENIHAEFSELEPDELAEKEDSSIPADPNVRNFSFTVVDSKLYYRENSMMNPVDTSATGRSRITGMIAIRDCVRELIEMETEDFSDDAIALQQKN